jgi:2-keto-4-pentenoate hydratase
MRALVARRAALLGAGRRHLGWKVGFGSAAAMQRLGTRAPLVGFLTDLSVLASGSTCSIAGWARAMLEPEVAAYVGKDVPEGAGPAEIRQAVAALGAAVELADLDPAVEGVESILAGNIYHRHVLLAPPDRGRAGGSMAGIAARVLRDGEQIAATADPEGLPGRLTEVLGSVAATLAGQGLGLRAGDVVIMGSLVPPIEVKAGQQLRAEIMPLGVLEVGFA